MKYTKHGIASKKKEINSIWAKLGHKLTTLIVFGLIVAIIGGGIMGCCAGIGAFKGILASSPDMTNIDVSPTGFSTFIYDRDGHQTAKLVASDSNRIPITLDQMPMNLRNAFIAIEDSRFYQHNGIDLKGILSAGYDAVKSKFKNKRGASTITQQLLKNNVFKDWTDEDSLTDTVKRKIQEQFLAVELEKVMEKDKILENYLNTINLGQNTLGVQAASLRYFNKDAYDLTLSECAVIAGITKNPSRLNPISHPEDNAERREKVLKDMLRLEMITQAQFDEAMADDVYSRIQNNNAVVDEQNINSYFDDAVTEAVYNDLLAAGYDEQQAYTLLYTGGLSIYSTQDPKLQAICDDVFSNEENYPSGTLWYLRYALSIERENGDTENFSSEMYKAHFKESNAKFDMLYKTQDDAYAAIEEYKAFVMNPGDEVIGETITLTPQPQISMTIENQSNGQILAMVGGRGQKLASRTLNRATSTVRQPGSCFKVLSTFAPALDSAGLSLATVQNDAPFNYINGKPVSNWYGESYRGISSIRDGIRNSMNIVTVKTLTQIGPQLGYDYLLNFGFTTLESSKIINGQVYSDIQQSLALGGITNGVTNMELNAAYAAIANGGEYIVPKLYTKVVDHSGNVILDNTATISRQVIKPTTAWLLTSAMMDVVNAGTATRCRIPGITVAGKTGTTQGYNDVWFAGYSGYYTATVWAGYDNNAKLANNQHDISKDMWQKVMARAHEGLENKTFPTPSGITSCAVCSRSGKLPIPGLCDAHVHSEYYEDGTQPTEHCDVHFSGIVCAYSMLPACESCPFRAEGVFELPLPEDPSLQQGNEGTFATGNVNYTLGEDGIKRCMHNAIFVSDPNNQAIIDQQAWELGAAAAAAQAQAEAAGEQQQAETQEQPTE